jgi:hypothetical protein
VPPHHPQFEEIVDGTRHSTSDPDMIKPCSEKNQLADVRNQFDLNRRLIGILIR